MVNHCPTSQSNLPHLMNELLQKTWNGDRICRRKRCSFMRTSGNPRRAAHRRRELAKAKAFEGRGNEIITFSVDRNIDYTNVCNVYCKFCAFWRRNRPRTHTSSRTPRSIKKLRKPSR